MLFRKRAQRKRRRIRKLRLLALLVVLLLLAAASFSVGLITAIAGQLPNLDPKRAQAGEVDGYVYADNGKTILAVLRGKEARVLVGWNDISPWMKHAIVDVEDKRFYEHRGVDLHGIMRAVWADVRNKSTVQGGSTITQQFVKNSLVHNERTISRKLKEAALAWQLESGPRHWSKTRILTAYLNTIYLGNGAYGVETASKAYFGHSAKTLTLPEAALLAGIPADPSRWDPVTHPRAAKARRRIVLLTMLRAGTHHACGLRAREQGAAAEARGRAGAGRPEPEGAVLHELRQAAARRRATGRPRSSAAACACARRSTCRCSRRRARRSRSG